jgi:hypothetical protein
MAASRSIMVTGRPASSAATAMPAPMVPPPTTPIWRRRAAGRRGPRESSAFALGEEGVDQAGALRAVEALQEQGALERQAFVKGQVAAACTHR